MREKTGFKNSRDASLATWTRPELETQGSRWPDVRYFLRPQAQPRPQLQVDTYEPRLTPESVSGRLRGLDRPRGLTAGTGQVGSRRPLT
uniref:Uncharacterized protein n=1 Tax=Equus asinus TaxID=9793 RepID=A0A8C4L4U3_EQUAS